jgi:membrane protease YdiL (CAAX protease family)
VASTLDGRRQRDRTTSVWSINTFTAGITGGLTIVGVMSGLGGLLAGIRSLPPDAILWLALILLGAVALLVGLALAVWKPEVSAAAGTITGLTAALLLFLILIFLLPGRPYNRLVFGWPGMSAVLVLATVGGWLGPRLGANRLRARLAISEAAQTGLYAVLLWISFEVVVRLVGSLGLGAMAGNALAGDMLATLIGFPLIAWIIAQYGQSHGIMPSNWEYRWSPVAIAVGVGAGLLIIGLMWGTALIDQALWGQAGTLPPAWAENLQAGLWVAVLLLAVNGIVVPICEELAWRGVVQTALVRAWTPVAGVLLTALLFALKHVVIDASVGRITTLLMLSLIVGFVRYRWGTGSSTIAHIATNLIATAEVLAAV